MKVVCERTTGDMKRGLILTVKKIEKGKFYFEYMGDKGYAMKNFTPLVDNTVNAITLEKLNNCIQEEFDLIDRKIKSREQMLQENVRSILKTIDGLIELREKFK